MEHIQTHHELSWQPCQGLYKSQTSGTTWGRKAPRGPQKERGGRAVVAAGQDPAGLKLGLQVMWAMSFWFEQRPVGLSQSREW